MAQRRHCDSRRSVTAHERHRGSREIAPRSASLNATGNSRAESTHAWGTRTVGAVKSDDKCLLVAWIDPASGDFVTSTPTVYDSILTIPVLTMMSVVETAMFHLTVFTAVPLAGAGVI